ncbi:MAG: hypothetical protein P8Q99_05690 [Paracoccaceae bacterium]|nr:hypothetical protein [Paracoccaceae bacterium]
MGISEAIHSVASSTIVGDVATAAWEENADEIKRLGVNNDRRCAMLIGQCAHESAKFLARSENLNYSADALFRVFRKYFPTRAECDASARQPEKIANRVYASRMGNGNTASGDGWKYRGRGYLQLTGRSNYRIFGNALALDLEAQPEMASEPAISWLIAAQYCASRTRAGKSLLLWADVPDVVMVTKGINGGTHGLDDRTTLTARAFEELSETTTASVETWQRALTRAGFDTKGIDGLHGPNTNKAQAAAEAKFGLKDEALLAKLKEIARK